MRAPLRLLDGRFLRLVNLLSARIGDFQIVLKETSVFMRFLYYGLFMPFWRRDFLTGSVTVVGYTVYVPSGLWATTEAYERLLAAATRWKIPTSS